jgi:hypothetical protein
LCKDVPALVRQRVELYDLSALWRVNLSRPDIGKPAEVLLMNVVRGDAGFLLRSVGDFEALCSVGRNLRADLIAFTRPA